MAAQDYCSKVLVSVPSQMSIQQCCTLWLIALLSVALWYIWSSLATCTWLLTSSNHRSANYAFMLLGPPLLSYLGRYVTQWYRSWACWVQVQPQEPLADVSPLVDTFLPTSWLSKITYANTLPTPLGRFVCVRVCVCACVR